MLLLDKRKRNYTFPNPFLFPWKINNSSYRVYRSLQYSKYCIGPEHSKNKWYILILISWSNKNMIDKRGFIACIYNAILLKKHFETMYFIVLISYSILKVCICLFFKKNESCLIWLLLKVHIWTTWLLM